MNSLHTKNNMQYIKRYCTNINNNNKLKMLSGLYINSIFWVTVIGGCYGFGKGLKDKKCGAIIVDETVESAFICGITWMCLPYSGPKNAYNYIKNKME